MSWHPLKQRVNRYRLIKTISRFKGFYKKVSCVIVWPIGKKPALVCIQHQWLRLVYKAPKHILSHKGYWYLRVSGWTEPHAPSWPLSGNLSQFHSRRNNLFDPCIEIYRFSSSVSVLADELLPYWFSIILVPSCTQV